MEYSGSVYKNKRRQPDDGAMMSGFIDVPQDRISLKVWFEFNTNKSKYLKVELPSINSRLDTSVSGKLALVGDKQTADSADFAGRIEYGYTNYDVSAHMRKQENGKPYLKVSLTSMVLNWGPIAEVNSLFAAKPVQRLVR